MRKSVYRGDVDDLLAELNELAAKLQDVHTALNNIQVKYRLSHGQAANLLYAYDTQY